MPRWAQRRRRPRRARGGRLFNLLAAACLGLSVVSVGWVVGVMVNPYGWFNPFPPRVQALEPPEPIVLVTSTPTALATVPAPVAAALTPSGTPADTGTPAPSATAEVARPRETGSAPTPTITLGLTPTRTASPIPRPTPTRSAFTYTAVITLQVHPVQVCDWMGVAGSVMDLHGKPALGAYVRVWGTGNVDQVVAAGANPVYGASGWEVRLARAQIVGSWNLQLVSSPDATSPLSDVYSVSMPGDCKKNLALVRLDQNH